MSTAAETIDGCLYFGRVMHKRLIPFRHRFSYRVFSVLLDIDRIDAVAGRLRLFSRNRRNLFSFHDRDHGHRDGRPLRPWAEALLARRGIDLQGGPIRLLCFPRLLGHVFNPLSIYFCHESKGKLRAIIYEVKNTFGQQHIYLLDVDQDMKHGDLITQHCSKNFYVSPFIDMEATYRFRLTEPDERLSILIRQSAPEGEILLATHTGRREALTDAMLLRAFFAYPLMTLKVVGAIHWEALRIWIKGAKFHKRPAPPKQEMSP